MWVTLLILILVLFLLWGLAKVFFILSHVVGTGILIYGFWKLAGLFTVWLMPYLTISLTCVGLFLAAACFRITERRRLTPPPPQAMLPPMSNPSALHARWWRPS